MAPQPGGDGTLRERIELLEASILLESLIRHRWNKSRAAKELGLSRVGLRAKLERYDLDKIRGLPDKRVSCGKVKSPLALPSPLRGKDRMGGLKTKNNNVTPTPNINTLVSTKVLIFGPPLQRRGNDNAAGGS